MRPQDIGPVGRPIPVHVESEYNNWYRHGLYDGILLCLLVLIVLVVIATITVVIVTGADPYVLAAYIERILIP